MIYRLTWLMIAIYSGLFAQAPVKVVIAGDSTVADYPAGSTQHGWGEYIQGYFNGNVHVVNLAKNGRSTKTFLQEGLWAQAIAEKPDIILIQFGHNDSHDPKNPEATSAKGDYSTYLKQLVAEARAAGATPILLTPVQRRTKTDSLMPYAEAMRKVAQQERVPVVDLHASSGKLYQEAGRGGAAELAANDKDQTHFNEKGARAMAALVMKELPALDDRLQKNLK
jgi:lysophospholipase L1-like esterase